MTCFCPARASTAPPTSTPWRPLARRLLALVASLALLLGVPSGAAAAERAYPETGQTVRGAFLDFFDWNGGLDIFGYPRSAEFELNGHRVQYFQRARFEWWPENPPGQQVQLGLLAVELGRARPPSIQSSDPNRRYFQETQHSIGGGFRDFWESRGGLAVFGYPITDELSENGLAVQYFQRARFEWHGENPFAYRVQLGLLGDEAIALGKAAIPAEAAPATAITLPPPLSGAAAGPGRLLVSTGAGGDFFLMNPDGTERVRLGRGVDPNISLDGTQVVFSRWDTARPGIYVLDIASGASRQVYEGQTARGAVFSPSMAEIAFYEKYSCIRVIRGRLNEEDDCFRVKVIPAGGGQDWLPAGQSGYATVPTWSPDGARLLFKNEKALYVVSRKEDARPLSKFEPRFGAPAWSPNGGQIAVTIDQNKDHADIGLLAAEGGADFTQITTTPPFTNPPITNLSPAWSPDGGRIAFASDRDGVLRIWTMNPDGSAAVRVSDLPLVSNNAWERFVSWGGR